jgi:hypothetical protein
MLFLFNMDLSVTTAVVKVTHLPEAQEKSNWIWTSEN